MTNSNDPAQPGQASSESGDAERNSAASLAASIRAQMFSSPEPEVPAESDSTLGSAQSFAEQIKAGLTQSVAPEQPKDSTEQSVEGAEYEAPQGEEENGQDVSYPEDDAYAEQDMQPEDPTFTEYYPEESVDTDEPRIEDVQTAQERFIDSPETDDLDTDELVEGLADLLDEPDDPERFEIESEPDLADEYGTEADDEQDATEDYLSPEYSGQSYDPEYETPEDEVEAEELEDPDQLDLLEPQDDLPVEPEPDTDEDDTESAGDDSFYGTEPVESDSEPEGDTTELVAEEDSADNSDATAQDIEESIESDTPLVADTTPEEFDENSFPDVSFPAVTPDFSVVDDEDQSSDPQQGVEALPEEVVEQTDSSDEPEQAHTHTEQDLTEQVSEEQEPETSGEDHQDSGKYEPSTTPVAPLTTPTPEASAEEPEPSSATQPDDEPASTKAAQSKKQKKEKSSRKWPVITGVIALLLVIGLAVAYLISSGKLGTGTNSVDDPSVDPVLPLNSITDEPEPVELSSQWASTANGTSMGQWSGIVADAQNGEILWNRDENTARTPASSTKILTAAAVLMGQDQDSTITTSLYEGINPGELVLVGAGDVTLGRDPQSAFFTDAGSLSDLAAAVDQPVRKIIIDNSWIENSPIFNENWSRSDIESGNVTQMTSVMMDAGRRDSRNADSPRTDIPATEVGKALASLLSVPSVPVEISNSPVPRGIELSSVQSAPLSVRLRDMLLNSDNILAEALAWDLSKSKGAGVGFAHAPGAALKVLQDNGFDTSGTTLTDNSGMSDANRIPVELLNQVMLAANGVKPDDAPESVITQMRSLMDDLPVAAATGSLEDRYLGPRSGPAAGWVRAKTGTLTDTTALVGSVTTIAGEELTFAFIANGFPVDVARAEMDVLLAQLRVSGTPAAQKVLAEHQELEIPAGSPAPESSEDDTPGAAESTDAPEESPSPSPSTEPAD